MTIEEEIERLGDIHPPRRLFKPGDIVVIKKDQGFGEKVEEMIKCLYDDRMVTIKKIDGLLHHVEELPTWFREDHLTLSDVGFATIDSRFDILDL
jgi:hypothetical protein